MGGHVLEDAGWDLREDAKNRALQLPAGRWASSTPAWLAETEAMLPLLTPVRSGSS